MQGSKIDLKPHDIRGMSDKNTLKESYRLHRIQQRYGFKNPDSFRVNFAIALLPNAYHKAGLSGMNDYPYTHFTGWINRPRHKRFLVRRRDLSKKKIQQRNNRYARK